MPSDHGPRGADTTVPAPERQDELRRAYLLHSDAPYRDVRINTLGELLWIMQERHWIVGTNRSAGTPRTDFRGLELRDVDLSGADLSEVEFRGTIMSVANLSGADLTRAGLSGVGMFGVDLRGANLTRVYFDLGTGLDDILVDEHTRLLGVRWNGAPLDGVDWSRVVQHGIGEETLIKKIRREGGRSPTQRHAALRTAYRQAARSYRGLYRELKELHEFKSFSRNGNEIAFGTIGNASCAEGM